MGAAGSVGGGRLGDETGRGGWERMGEEVERRQKRNKNKMRSPDEKKDKKGQNDEGVK